MIKPSIGAQGEVFWARKVKLPAGLRVSSVGNPGDLGTAGIYRNKPTPYGHITVQPFEKFVGWNCFLPFLHLAEIVVARFQEMDAETVWIGLDMIDDGQFSFSFGVEELEILHKIGIQVNVFSINAAGFDELLDA